MSDLALSLRLARPADAAPLARIYVEAWQDTYAAILPHALLSGMSVGVHTARIERAIKKSSPLPDPPDPALFQRTLKIKYRPFEE